MKALLLPRAQLPQDVRELAEPPFEVDWHAVAAVFQLDAAVRPDPLKDTLKRKELVKTLSVADLVARLDPATPLGQEVRAAQEAHLAEGNPFETFT